MKKLILLSFVLVVFLVGCGKQSTSQDFDSNIIVVSREEGSGTRGAFVELTKILEVGPDGSQVDRTTKEAITQMQTETVITSVAGNRNSIGYISTGSLQDTVKAISIDGVDPTTENIKGNKYKLSRPFNIVTGETRSNLVQDFISFIMSKDGQEIISENYIAIDDNLSPYKGNSLTGKIVVAGSTSVSPVMEKIREAYIKINPDIEIEIQQTGSSAGIKAVIDGTADIGMASRELKDSEKSQLSHFPMALDGIAIILNRDNPINNMDLESLKNIFIGDILNWKEIN